MKQKLSENTDAIYITDKKLGGWVKFLGLILLVAVSFGVSIYLVGFIETLKKVVLLAILTLLGFIAFYIIYGILYLISAISYSRKRKKLANMVINCDEEVAIICSDERYRYSFNIDVPVKQNFSDFISLAKSAISSVADGYNKGGKNFYLNYSAYDALGIISDVIDKLDDKLSGTLNFLKLNDKPIGILESALTNLIDKEKQEQHSPELPAVKDNFFTKLFAKAGRFLIKGKVDDLANDIIVFAIYESCKTFSKDGDEFNVEAFRKGGLND